MQEQEKKVQAADKSNKASDGQRKYLRNTVKTLEKNLEEVTILLENTVKESAENITNLTKKT